MGYSIEFVLSGTPRGINQYSLKSYYQRQKDKLYWYEQVKLATLRRIPPAPLERFQITVIRKANRMLDFDNLTGSFKYVIDGLIPAGIIANDGWKNTNKWIVDQEFCKKGREHILVRITELIPEEH